MIKYVTYKRVSTKKQGESGLGIEAQERDIRLFLDQYSGTPYQVVGEFVDVESGSNSNRSELTKAIKIAKAEKAILLVAKLDRLSRKVSFIANLLEDKALDFKVASMPNADKFQLHIYAALAEQERDFISKRTKAALAAAKDKGVRLGGNPENVTKMNRIKSEKATQYAERLRGLITTHVNSGSTLQEIANNLESAGIKTIRGSTQTATSVRRIIQRLGLTPVSRFQLQANTRQGFYLCVDSRAP